MLSAFSLLNKKSHTPETKRPDAPLTLLQLYRKPRKTQPVAAERLGCEKQRAKDRS